MHETHRICSSKLGQLYRTAVQERREDIWNYSWQKENGAKAITTWYLMFIYVAVMQMENFHLKWIRLMEIGTMRWLVSGLDVTGCESTWTQSSSCSVPPAEKSCLSCATTYFQSVTGMWSSVRLWLSLSLSLWSIEHPNPVTEQKGDLC